MASIDESNCCSNPCIIFDGEVKCKSCGTTFGEQLVGLIDRVYDDKIKRLHNDEPLSFTTMGDINGIELGYCKVYHPSDSGLLYRLRMWHNRSKLQGNRGSIRVYSLISDYCSILHLPDYVKSTAFRVMDVARSKHFTRGHDLESFVCGSILYSSRLNDSDQRTLDVILDKCMPAETDDKWDYNRRLVSRVFSFINNVVKPFLEVKYPNGDWSIKPVRPINVVPYLIGELGLDASILSEALKVLDDFKPFSNCSGRSPVVIAATSLYLACLITGEFRTQKSVAKAAILSEASLRVCFKDILKYCPAYRVYSHYKYVF